MDSYQLPKRAPEPGGKRELAAAITKAGSKQTYYTFLLLADRDKVQDAFRAYAYFRWLDDLLDCDSGTKHEKVSFIQRQQSILDDCYQGKRPVEVSHEEQLLVDLIRSGNIEHPGLQIYLRNMMKVMAFDLERCGRAITHAELTEYTHLLSSAVTELLYYLIGNKDAPTSSAGRYHAVNGAHVVHLLRDTVADISVGYFNLPSEFIRERQISLTSLTSLPFRKWVYGRVKLARQYFVTGRKYIARVKNFRCRLAGFAYLARFEWMLRAIEKDQYYLRPDYPERKSIKAAVWIVGRVLLSVLNLPWVNLDSSRQTALIGQCEEG